MYRYDLAEPRDSQNAIALKPIAEIKIESRTLL